MPGMTGWAQVNGNIELSWQERILLDVWYVDHWSLGLDLAILVRTIGVVLRGEWLGTNAAGRLWLMRIILVGAVEGTRVAFETMAREGLPPVALVTLPHSRSGRHSDYVGRSTLGGGTECPGHRDR